MRINESKTKVMLFNTSRNLDFPPELTLPKMNNFLDVVEHTRLLGLQITTDLRWSAHSNFIIKRANTKLWMLRRMKLLNIDYWPWYHNWFLFQRNTQYLWNGMPCFPFRTDQAPISEHWDDTEKSFKDNFRWLLSQLWSCMYFDVSWAFVWQAWITMSFIHQKSSQKRSSYKHF